MPDLEALIEIAIAELARRPGERQRHQEILRLQEAIQRAAPKVMDHLLALEKHVNAREAAAIEVALLVGLRAGRAAAHAAEHDEEPAALLRELAVIGLNLTRLQRLRAFVELLALEVSVDDDR